MVIDSSFLSDSLQIFNNDDLAISDHTPQIFNTSTLLFQKNLTPNSLPSWNFKKDNCQKYNELSRTFPEIDFHQNIDSKYD